MNVIKNLNLKFKLILFVVFLTLITIALISIVSVSISKDALSEQATSQLRSQGFLNLKRVESYLNRTVKSTSSIASNRLTEGLFIAYESTFYGSSFEVGEDLDIYNQYYKNLDKRYLNQKKKTLKDLEIFDYLLVNTGGQVVFTANNKVNSYYLGKNLINGVYKQSPLKTCFTQAFNSKTNKVYFTDFFFNFLSKNVEAFFCKSKVAEFDNMDEGISKGDVIGVVMVRLNRTYLDSLLNLTIGAGKTGQSYLVGEDLLLRSNSFKNNELFNPISSFSKKLKIDNITVIEGLSGKNGDLIAKNIEDREMISSFRSFDFMNKKYVLITEKELSEVTSSISSLITYITIISLITFIFIILICLFVMGKIINPILKASESLHSISENLLEGSAFLEKTSEKLGKGSVDLSSSIHETVSSMDEITGMVNSTIKNVSSSKKSSNEMVQNAVHGQSVVNQMQISVNDISSNNEDVVNKMNEIVSHIEDFRGVVSEIGDKTKVINDIVFQTKLLSFNASVEAARAGEHGKGFSVVAEEVGLLAKASGEAADEIGVLIERNLRKVNDIVEETTKKVEEVKENGSVRISEGHKKSQECGEVLNSIIGSVNDVSTKIESIENASTESAEGIKEINKAIHLIDTITQETSVIASKNKESAESLSLEANKLESIYKMLDSLVRGRIN